MACTAAAMGNGQTHRLLREACERGDVETVRKHLAKGAKPNTVDETYGAPALHWAVSAGSVEAAKLLLEAGADLKGKDRRGLTALHAAAMAGQLACVTLLLQRGADLRCAGQGGLTVLHLAAGEGHLAVVQALLRAGAYIKATTEDGR